MNQSSTKRKIAEAAMVLVILAVLALSIMSMVRMGGIESPEQVRGLTEGWYYVENGARHEIRLPASLESGNQEGLVLYNDTLLPEDAGKTLTVRGARYNVKAAVGSQVIYEYSDRLFPRNDQMKAKLDCDAVLPLSLGGDILALTFENTKHGKYDIPEVYIGSSGAVLRRHFAEAALPLGIVFAMAVLAVFAVGISLYLCRQKQQDRRFVNVAWFLILCGIWCLTDSSLIQVVGKQSPVICLISFYAFMVMSVPMLHFLKNTGEMKKYRSIDVWICMFYVNAVLQGILNYLGIFDFIQMLFVTHLLLAAGVGSSVRILLGEYRQKKDRESFTILLAFAMLGAGGVIALLLYWILEIPHYEVIYECGIIIFIALILCGIVTTMIENIHFRAEMMVYRRLAKEDRLTGLGNRRAFEEQMAQIQKSADTYRDAVLIFMDLNKLKYINDHFGHNAGDEAIVAAARCIENVFAKEGTCYRIGGDEFCAVIIDPTGTAEEWFERLDREILFYNGTVSRGKLSIARGFSYLREENGSVKSISDWKYQADKKMYENKRERR